MKRRIVTKLLTKGAGPCGDVEVTVQQVSQDKCRLTCTKCGRRVNVVVFGGKIDVEAFARLEEGVTRLHQDETN